MLAALALLETGSTSRSIWLYDTFAGMTEPTEVDGSEALRGWANGRRDDHNTWCFSPKEEVHQNMKSTGYPAERIQLIEGPVEESLPNDTPLTAQLLSFGWTPTGTNRPCTSLNACIRA